MDLNELYKEIEKAEVDLNAKRLKYIKEALVYRVKEIYEKENLKSLKKLMMRLTSMISFR